LQPVNSLACFNLINGVFPICFKILVLSMF
jgi:hypothetical protein